jgi:hypothetical protein
VSLYEPVLEPEPVAVLLAELLPVRDEDDDDEPLAEAEPVAVAVAETRETIEEDDVRGSLRGRSACRLTDCD